MSNAANIARIVAYWRDSLADAELEGLDAKQEAVLAVKSSTLSSGKIPKATVAKIFKIAEEDASDTAKADASKTGGTPESIAVTIAPIVAQRRSRGRRRRRNSKRIFPLLIPAVLNSDGLLQPQGDEETALPWLPRPLLEPTSSNLVLGDVKTLEQFYANQTLNLNGELQGQQWRAVWLYAQQMLCAVASDEWKQSLHEAGYQATSQGLIAISEQMTGVAQNIITVYDRLLATKKWSPLLQKYVSPEPSPPREPLSPLQWQRSARLHLGSFHTQFSLSPSQREALYNFLALLEDSVLAVSGPPGTGKTTLLHSVIASRWIKAALEKKDPPVIVVSSTNNQAVTNVVDSLKNVGEVERWIDVPSFGLYLVNSSNKQKAAAARGIATANRWGKGIPSSIENEQFISKEKRQFLEQCSNHFDTQFDTVDAAVTALHEALKETAQEMFLAINTVFDLAQSQEQLRKFEKEGGIEAYREKLQGPLNAAESRLNDLKTVYDAWRRHVAEEPVAYTLLSPVPAVRYRRTQRNRRFLQKHLPGAMVEPKTKAVTAYLEKHLSEQRQKVEQIRKPLAKFYKAQQRLEKAAKQWQEWREARETEFLDTAYLFDLENEAGEAEERSLLNWLDTHLRFELFVLATHYWEGRWLQEVEAIGAANPDFKEPQRRDVQEQKWQRYAMLTPCFVTTMHSGPGFFDYYDGQPQPLLDFIDLLIVDEAGQVTPEVGGAMFALSRQALVVGDVKQIEPVWSIPEPVDLGNLERHGLAPDTETLTRVVNQGVMASSGSVMQMAQYVSPYQIPVQDGVTYERGMFLAEHRRCVPEIITYCNELAYSGRLRKKRKSLADHPWPHMGYAHVKGKATRRGGSRQNEREARAVALWLAENRKELEEHYGANIDDVVGIITPFAAQKRAIRAALGKHGIRISKLGTVHALQGGERPVVLFSTVYSDGDPGPYFFDRGPNMLNVAVSRAKDSFLVFGDMDILDPDTDSPSGLLARHLFASPDNELLDAPVPERVKTTSKVEVHHIRSLKRHRATLRRAFEKAEKDLIIVSPYLRWRAVQADDVCRQVKSTVARGADVTIYVDDGFNESLSHPSAARAADALRQSGANVVVCHNIHSKIICIDDEIYIEGSFNWLSAERTIEEYRRYETSIIYTGAQAPEFIGNVRQDMDNKILTA